MTVTVSVREYTSKCFCLLYVIPNKKIYFSVPDCNFHLYLCNQILNTTEHEKENFKTRLNIYPNFLPQSIHITVLL